MENLSGQKLEELKPDNAAGKADDALINKIAAEMVTSKAAGVETIQKAPDNAVTRYGVAALQGLAKTPEGFVNAAKHAVNDPLSAVETVGMGAALAVGLKAVLPAGGPAGKIAAVAVGGYFTYEAAKPIYEGMKKAGVASTMADMNAASSQVGNALGTFAFDSVLAVGGYKLGAKAADKMFATSAGAKFVSAREGFYDKLSNKAADALGVASLEAGGVMKPRHFHPEGYGVIPPYLLQELAAKNPGNPDFARTHAKTVEMQNKQGGLQPRNQPAPDQAKREVYDAKQREQLPGEKARFEGDKAHIDPEVNQIYDYTGEIRAFYENVHKWNGIDGKGMKYVSTVNYGKNYENAFWNGTQMTYGRPGPDSPFKTFVLRDVTAHEITHGITEMEAGTRYWGQAGALNESYSDVFGALAEQFTRKQTADKASWLMGEGIWKETVKNGRALRDMKNPGTAYNDPAIGKDPQPGHMKDYYRTWGDNGGVHYNSGIPNRAFANFAIDVGGFAWEKPGQIWFDARKMAGDNPSFAQFAYHTVEAAKKAGHNDLVPKLEKAWDSVGVKPDKNAKDTHTPGAGGADDAASTGTSMLKRLLGRAS